MKTIGTVLLVLVTVMGMAMPVLGAESGSSTSAGTDGDLAWSSSLTGANTPSTNAGAGSFAIGDDSASTSAGSLADEWVLDAGESSLAGTDGSGDLYSSSGAGASAENWWTGYAESGSNSEAIGDASTSAESGAAYDWTPASGDMLVVSAGSGASASGDAAIAGSYGGAETYWIGDVVESNSDAYASGDIAATGGSSDAGDLDNDGYPDAVSDSGASASGNAFVSAWSDASSTWI